MRRLLRVIPHDVGELGHFVLALAGTAALTLSASPLSAATNPRPGYPDHERAVIERIRAERTTQRTDRTVPNLTATATPPDNDGEWSHLGVPELGGHVAVYDPLRDRMLVFGGDDNGVFNYDLWALSMTDLHPWKKLAPAGTLPPQARAAVYDPVRDRMIILGAAWPTENTNDLWTVNLAGAMEWKKLSPTGTRPDISGTVIYDAVRDRLILSNGSASIWTLSLSGTPAWSEVVTAGTPAGARSLPIAVYDSARDRMVFWGGENDDWPLPTDVWTLSLSGTPTWSQLPASGTPPEGRFATTAIYDPVNDRMIVYAGSNYHSMRDAWSLSLAGNPAWTEIQTPQPTPFQRSFHTAVYDAKRNRMVIFSGWGWDNGPPDRNDVWALALSGDPAWTPVLGTSPEPREGHAAIYDPDGDRMLVFGGDAFGAPSGMNRELWSCSLDESPTWAQLHPIGVGPAAEHSIAMYDDVRHRMIVLVESEVWALSLRGALKWAHLDPRGESPPEFHSAIFDSRHHRVVALAESDNSVWELSLSNQPRWQRIDAIADQPVIGGSVAIYDRKRDRLLIWGESNSQEMWALPLSGQPRWTRLTPTGPYPTPRFRYTLINDEKRDRLVLYRGHHHGDDYFPWALSLSGPLAWQELTTADDRSFCDIGHSAIYDPVRDRMIVFGGAYFYNELNETWALAFGAVPSVEKRPLQAAAALQAAYPNPFNPSVTIPFTLASDGEATLAIYDVAGRLVRTLVDEWTSRGSRTVAWEGTSDTGERVSSGIYFCRLRVAGIVETRKLVMLK